MLIQVAITLKCILNPILVKVKMRLGIIKRDQGSGTWQFELPHFDLVHPVFAIFSRYLLSQKAGAELMFLGVS